MKIIDIKRPLNTNNYNNNNNNNNNYNNYNNYNNNEYEYEKYYDCNEYSEYDENYANEPFYKQQQQQQKQQQEEEFLQLQYTIEAKRKMLLNKQKRMQNIVKQNTFLENVKNDYIKYNEYIVKQKQDQMTALKLLNDYIYDLSTSGELSKHNIHDAKMEQNKIVKELKTIKRGLDKIMNETTDISNLLVKKNNNRPTNKLIN
jgi:hypothetical protein